MVLEPGTARSKSALLEIFNQSLGEADALTARRALSAFFASNAHVTRT
jgi:hypothetical protein